MRTKTFSTRYAPAVLALLLLTAMPTAMHSYLDSTIPDGRSARALSARLGGEIGTPTSRRESWGKERLASADWIERRYPGPPPVTLFVGRSFDSKRLYHHPELALDYGHDYASETIVRLTARPDVPIHLLTGTGADARRVAVYALRHDDRYVADPIRFQLRASLRLLVRRRQAMTLFFASQDLATGVDVESSRAVGLLLEAIGAFEQQSTSQRQ